MYSARLADFCSKYCVGAKLRLSDALEAPLKEIKVARRAFHPALRHGLYSALSVLPGEDYAAFQKLSQQLIDEYAPNGVSEVELVRNLARLFWRKQHLTTYHLADLAQRYCEDVVEKRMRELSGRSPLAKDVEARERRVSRAREEVEREVREELGPQGDLLDFTQDHESMMRDLAVHEKVDAMIARTIKQLLFLKGLKTVAGLGPPATSIKPQVNETKPPLRLAAPEPVTTAMPPPRTAAKK
jgi:hypothetical protein